MNIKNLLVLVLLVTSLAAYKSPEERACIRECLQEHCADYQKHSSHWLNCNDTCLEDCHYEHN